MTTLVAHELSELLAHRESPCVSLYQPTYRSVPEKSQNAVRFRNLLKQAEAALGERFGKRRAEDALEPLLPLASDPQFWNYVFDGLAVLAAPGLFRTFKLHRPVPELAVVADSFHVKPLLRILQAADRYQVLGISASEARIFEGNRDGLDELPPGDGVPRTIMEALPNEFTDPSMPPGVDPKSAKGFGGPVVHVAPRSRSDSADKDMEHFFRVVDRAVTEHHSRPSGLPLLLATLGQHQTVFRYQSENPFLLPDPIEADPGGLSRDQLRQRAWTIIEQRYRERLAQLGEEFQEKKSKGLADDDLRRVAEAAVASRIGTLLIAGDRQKMGRLDPASGAITLGQSAEPYQDDVYDDLAELVLARGGEVLILSPGDVPAPTGLAGIYRF